MLENRGEVYFSFSIPGTPLLNELTNVISIDKITADSVYSYANKDEFEKFCEFHIGFTILIPPSLRPFKTTKILSDSLTWNYYPSYKEYLDLMYGFEDLFPDLCELYEIGESVQGRQILAVKISDNVSTKEEEPEFFYSSTIHGDEVVGYVFMLRLIDFLLTNYSKDTKVSSLVNNVEIWINPLANPDGAFFFSDTSIVGAKRYNANNIDLNRNFPDPSIGSFPDKNIWQPETYAMIEFMESHNFVL